MFCTQCGKSIQDNAPFCGHCGVPLEATVLPLGASGTVASEVLPITAQVTSVAQVRPWVRYWARIFDIYLAAIVGGLAIGIFSSNAFAKQGTEQLLGFVIVFAWVFIESLLLSTMGTTPGKWLFKTSLIPPSGEKPDFSTALSRSFKVWWRGLGIGFPLASIFTLIVAYGKLKKNGITTWDEDMGFTVVHERIGPIRIIAAIIFFMSILLLAVVGSAANA